MSSQADMKTFLGPYYDENEYYYFGPEARSYDLLARSTEEVYCGYNEVAEGELIIPVVINIRFDGFDSRFMDDKKFLNQPLDKIKKSSVYDKLVKNYGFNDEDYLNGDTEALWDYYTDIKSTMNSHLKSGVKIYLKQYYVLTEDALKELEESDKCFLEARGFDISKIEGVSMPEIFEELGMLDTILERSKETMGEVYSASLPKCVHHAVTLSRL